MKKHLLTLCIAFTGTQLLAQNWQATTLTTVTYLPVTSMESHKNDLFATVFNGSTAVLYKLNANNTSWSTISTGSVTVPRALVSAGTRLYLGSVVSGVYSLLYYTYDGGTTLIVDTVGLPKSFSGISLIAGLQYYNGKVIANLGGSGYWIKDTSTVKWKKIDVSTALNGGVDPVTYYNDTLYAYDNTGTNTFYYSGDWGTTWTARPTNLPGDFGTNKLVADQSTGRIYAGGAWSSSTLSGVYYSDNQGKTWTLAPLSTFIKKNSNNNPQLVTSIYANGNDIYFGLENNKNTSAPDVLSSSTGIAGIGYDTLGLPANAGGGVYGVRFVKHNGMMALALNVIDVYLKGGSIGIRDNTAEAALVTLYPNPAMDRLHILNQKNIAFAEVKIIDALGKQVYSGAFNHGDVDVARLPKGTYFLQLITGDKIQQVQKFVKE